MAQLKKYARL